VIIELQEQLLAWERELDSGESTIFAWEEGLKAFAHALGEVSVENDAVWWDFSSQVCASYSGRK
jgi:hypothetical protein